MPSLSNVFLMYSGTSSQLSSALPVVGLQQRQPQQGLQRRLPVLPPTRLDLARDRLALYHRLGQRHRQQMAQQHHRKLVQRL